MDNISVVVFDTRLMQESRQMEIDFVDQLDVYCRRPRQWDSFVGMLEANQLEYRSRLCENSNGWYSTSSVRCWVRHHGRSGLWILPEHVKWLAL